MHDRFTVLTMMATVAAVLAPSTIQADYRSLPLPELVRKAEIIARVKILSTEPTSRVDPDAGEKRPGLALPRLAQARVLERLKGTGTERELAISYDASRICPGVRYAVGEECIVFLVRGKGGLLETLNWDTGKKPLRTAQDAAAWTVQIRDLLKTQPPGTKKVTR